ncbi:MAG TPA: hypothetical protein VES79_05010 [Solirubrobacteraceae bacterium]|nr:hypothetical protein [Solirubrobacteraceae bacterium]
MTSLQASRTLVKSPPELWAELSDLGSLARHLGEFGEIRITKVDPESRVEWEADRASGTVRLEPSGWGTRVVLTVDTPVAEPEAEAHPVSDPQPDEPALAEPEREPEPEPVVRRGFWARLFRWPAPEPATGPLADEPELEPEPVVAKPAAGQEPERSFATIEWETLAPSPEEKAAARPIDREGAHAVLTSVLDTLGAAHHRPFSRP